MVAEIHDLGCALRIAHLVIKTIRIKIRNERFIYFSLNCQIMYIQIITKPNHYTRNNNVVYENLISISLKTNDHLKQVFHRFQTDNCLYFCSCLQNIKTMKGRKILMVAIIQTSMQLHCLTFEK